MPDAIKRLVCSGCGREFYFNRKKQYCSPQCRPGQKKQILIKNCAACGKQYVHNHKNRKSCSKLCTTRLARGVTEFKPAQHMALIEKNRRLVGRGIKVCSQCKHTMPFKKFEKSKTGTGGVASICKRCDRERVRRNKEIARRKAGATPRAVLEDLAEARKEQRLRKAKARRRRGVWESLWLAQMPTDTAFGWRERYKTDPEFNIKERLRAAINKKKKRGEISNAVRDALKRCGRSPMAEKALGYSISELRSHLELQFTKGMCWERFNRGEIHIDHIVPQSVFDLTDDEEWRECWSLSNLRPVFAQENLAKGAKQEFLL